jgi:hypothetical protein
MQVADNLPARPVDIVLGHLIRLRFLMPGYLLGMNDLPGNVIRGLD